LLAALAGSLNTVRIYDWRREFRSGDPRSQGQVPSGPFSFNDATIFTDGTGFVVGSGNPALATGAPRGALSIQTQGWYPNALAIGAGDMIGLAGRLYIATEAITASGTGTATIPIAPPLREALLVNQPLVLTRPSVPMRLVSCSGCRVHPTAAGFSRPFGRHSATSAVISRSGGTITLLTRPAGGPRARW
jgi:hypothetical protein